MNFGVPFFQSTMAECNQNNAYTLGNIDWNVSFFFQVLSEMGGKETEATELSIKFVWLIGPYAYIDAI